MISVRSHFYEDNLSILLNPITLVSVIHTLKTPLLLTAKLFVILCLGVKRSYLYLCTGILLGNITTLPRLLGDAF